MVDIRMVMLFVNFFFLAIALLSVYYYAFRLRIELRCSRRLKAESDRYKELFNSTSEGVTEVDADGRFVIINRGGAFLLGYEDPQSLLTSGSRIQDFFVDPAEWKTLSGRILSSGIVNQTVQIQTFHKGKIWIELTFHKRPVSPEQNHIEGIFRDVTERLAMQEELKSYSENLEQKVIEKTEALLQLERHKFNLEKLAATGQLVAQLVHELRNPLSSIKVGLTSIRKRAVLEKGNAQIIEIAIRETAHLERMMKEMLAFARPEALQFNPCQINDVLNDTLESLREQLRSASCTLTCELNPLPYIPLDRSRMQQVFTNLIMNSQQAADSDRRLVIRTGISDGSVFVDIQDFGQGIPSDQIEHIFDPFFSRREGGTGLGLTVVKTIVEAHGGAVTIDSEPGRGTTIRISIPVREPPGRQNSFTKE
jgi:PAS domain S-box-containing protein